MWLMLMHCSIDNYFSKIYFVDEASVYLLLEKSINNTLLDASRCKEFANLVEVK